MHSAAMENFLARSRRSARLRAHLRKAEIDTARLEKRQHSKQGAGYTSYPINGSVGPGVSLFGKKSIISFFTLSTDISPYVGYWRH